MPPAIVKPFANDVGVTPLIVLFVNDSVPAIVAKVPVVGNVTFVVPIAVNVVVKLPAVVNPPAVVKSPPNEIGLPPILLTVGAPAAPPKSPVN